MGRAKEKLTDYKNFWLIWLTAAPHENGISLFRIQTSWGIQTNYLYHKEAGLGRPIFKLMAEQGYVEAAGSRIKAKFGWIAGFLESQLKSDKPAGGYWSPELVVRTKWPAVGAFMEKNSKAFFDPDSLHILYRGDRDVLGTYGRYVFQHIFLYVLFSNLIAFSKRYHAEVVTKMLSTAISLGAGADVLNYLYHLHSQLAGAPGFPALAADEQELSRMLCALKW